MKDILLETLDAVIRTYKDNLTIINDEKCIYKDDNLKIVIFNNPYVLEIEVDYPDCEWNIYTYAKDDNNEWEEISKDGSSNKHNLMQDLIDIASLDSERYLETVN